MPRVVHFEIPVDNADRAVKFYSDAFGWKVQKWEGPIDYWLVTTGEEGEPGIDGALTLRADTPAVTDTIDVADLDAAIGKVTAGGGKITVPRMAVPGVGYMAYFQDTEGNVFGMMQSEESATG